SISGSGNYTVNVRDTGKDGSQDKLIIKGTESSDTFLLRRDMVAAINGPGLTERINYNGNIELLEIYGEGGNNKFYLDDNSTVTKIYGGSSSDFFQVGQMFGTNRNIKGARAISYSNGMDAVHTTRGYLSRGISYDTYIYGGSGNDTFSVYSNKAPLWLYGETGNDDFIVRAFALAERAEDGSVMYNINDVLHIEGGSGENNVTVVGTEFGRGFDITGGSLSGLGLNLNITGVEEVEIVRDLPLEPGIGLDGQAEGPLPKKPFMYRDVVIFIIIAAAAVLCAMAFILWRRRRLIAKDAQANNEIQ
ncbi:MAG: hypothetical protein ACOYEJ_02325, partial [Mahellales bacterium]